MRFVVLNLQTTPPEVAELVKILLKIIKYKGTLFPDDYSGYNKTKEYSK